MWGARTPSEACYQKSSRQKKTGRNLFCFMTLFLRPAHFTPSLNNSVLQKFIKQAFNALCPDILQLKVIFIIFIAASLLGYILVAATDLSLILFLVWLH